MRLRAVFRGHPAAAVAAVVLSLIVLATIFAPWIAPFSPVSQELNDARLPPSFLGGSSAYLLGTDSNGRDLLTRLLYGGRISLAVGLVGATVAAFIGTVLGLIAGFVEGGFGAFIQRLADIKLSLPFYVIALAVAATLGPDIWNMLVLLSFWGWPNYARVVAVVTARTKRLDFVVASRMQGSVPVTILFTHILPRCMGSVIVVWSTMIGSYILVESALSFIGVGVQIPSFSWGSMLAGAQLELSVAWWAAVFPGLLLTIVIVSIYVLGDFLSQILEVNTKR